MNLKSVAKQVRTGLWHLRNGGPEQLKKWQSRKKLSGPYSLAGPGSGRARRKGAAFDPLDIPEYQDLDRPRAFEGMRVAVIMDDFSLRAWGHEFTTVQVTPDNWQAELDRGVDLLFVESAWNGNGGAWQYQLTGSKAPTEPLRQLVAACKDRDIPTVFWNKEDPPHFNDFLDTAKLFDVVFTSDSNKIEDYKRELGHDRVDSLSFAAQPSIHNPVRSPELHQIGDIAFGGMYFAHKYPERREQMDLLLGAASRVSKRGYDFTIYSRFAGQDENYQFPAPLDKHVVGSLPYDKMLTAYRTNKVFLNVNSVVDSPSMCARRVFEIAASGTPVVSTPSVALQEFFPHDEVPLVDNTEEAEWTIRALLRSPQFRDRMVHKAQRRIWQNHTYTHRAEQVFRAASLPVENSILNKPSITAMVSTNRPQQLDHILSQVSQQRDVNVQLALCTHGFDTDIESFKSKAMELGLENVTVFRGDESWKLGDCLNKLVEVADGDFAAKVDDDDIYAPQYLRDQINAVWYSGADLVGKQACYLYLGSMGATLLRFPEREHQWTTFVAGPTLLGPTETFRNAPFESRTHGEDSAFLRLVADQGGKTYSTDRFNFLQVRGNTQHTWQSHDLEFLANSEYIGTGYNPDFVVA